MSDVLYRSTAAGNFYHLNFSGFGLDEYHGSKQAENAKSDLGLYPRNLSVQSTTRWSHDEQLRPIISLRE